MLQLVVALSAICGIVGCAAGLEESKRTDSRIFPFWQAAPSQACWTPFPAWSVTKPFCHHHVAQATALCGSPVKAASEHTSVIALNNSLHLHCYSWRRLTDASCLLEDNVQDAVFAVRWAKCCLKWMLKLTPFWFCHAECSKAFADSTAFQIHGPAGLACWNGASNCVERLGTQIVLGDPTVSSHLPLSHCTHLCTDTIDAHSQISLLFLSMCRVYFLCLFEPGKMHARKWPS